MNRDQRRSDATEPASIPDALRPLSYVPAVPVVRRVGERDLFIGNVHAADPSAHDRRFDHVVSATADPQPLTTDHHPLEDGPGNTWGDFAAAVDATRRRYRQDGSVLVHCKAGISRSSTLLSAALAVEEGRSFTSALDLVRETRRWAFPHPALHEWGVYYVAAHG